MVIFDTFNKNKNVKKSSKSALHEILPLKIENQSTFTEKTEVQTQLFADVTLGFARIGPSLGVRYYKNFKNDFDSWQFYAIWKF